MAEGMVYAQFDNPEAAQAWRKVQGGWILAVDDARVFWYSLHFTPGQIMVHPSNAGMSGVLV